MKVDFSRNRNTLRAYRALSPTDLNEVSCDTDSVWGGTAEVEAVVELVANGLGVNDADGWDSLRLAAGYAGG